MADFDTYGMAADFGEMLSGITQASVVFSSKRKSGPQTVRACIGEAVSGTNGSEEGILPEDDLSFTVLAAEFVAAGWVPTTGDVVRVDGYAYRVRRARKVVGDVTWAFDCEAVAR
jgi:hypothetical protein